MDPKLNNHSERCICCDSEIDARTAQVAFGSFICIPCHLETQDISNMDCFYDYCRARKTLTNGTP